MQASTGKAAGLYFIVPSVQRPEIDSANEPVLIYISSIIIFLPHRETDCGDSDDGGWGREWEG